MIWILHSLVEGVIVFSTWDFFIFQMVYDLSKVNLISLLSFISVGFNKFVIRILAEFMLWYVIVFIFWIIVIWLIILFIGFCWWTWEALCVTLQIICDLSGVLLWYHWDSAVYWERLVAWTVFFAFFIFNLIYISFRIIIKIIIVCPCTFSILNPFSFFLYPFLNRSWSLSSSSLAYLSLIMNIRRFSFIPINLSKIFHTLPYNMII